MNDMDETVKETGIPAKLTAADIAGMIDQTFLSTTATKEQMTRVCEEVKSYHFCVLAINPYWVPYCHEILKNTSSKISASVGFPLGANTTATKVFEAIDSIQNGAGEIDFVMNVSALKCGDFSTVAADMREITKACHDRSVVVKVILENCLLTDFEKETACQIAREEQLDFVKTSTGLSTGGATVEDVRLMRRVVGPLMGVKAAGGIRTYQDILKLWQAGATRFGTSAGVAIMKEALALEEN
jgi:deoxyribose-phosphate aldolase